MNGFRRNQDTKKSWTVAEFVEMLEAAELTVAYQGNEKLSVDHTANLITADEKSLCFYTGEDCSSVSHLEKCILVCLSESIDVKSNVTRIFASNPRLAFTILAQVFAPPLPEPGIHPTAVVSEKAEIDNTAYIGPYCVLDECEIGANTVLFSHVSIMNKTRIGDDCIIEPNACIGQYGHGFEWAPNGKQWVMPQLGGVVIGNNCYVGASSVISRGALQDTILENWVRVAENSLIGHNSKLQKGTFVANGVSVAGKTTTGRHCWLGTGASVCNQITLADYVTVGAGACVVKDCLEAGAVLTGVPATVKSKKTIPAYVREKV